MLTINNNKFSVKLLLNAINQTGVIPVFDLDEVLFCAKHRQKLYSADDVKAGKCSADRIGQLDLDHYRANTKAELVKQDKSLALLEVVHRLNELQKPYHVATARVICPHTAKLLHKRGIKPVLAMGRNGENDNRRDHILKTDHLKARFTPREIKNVLLIDDNEANCKAFIDAGAQAVRVVA